MLVQMVIGWVLGAAILGGVLAMRNGLKALSVVLLISGGMAVLGLVLFNSYQGHCATAEYSTRFCR